MRMMCLRLLRGVRSGCASVDTMGALSTPCLPYTTLVQLFSLGLGLGLDLATAHGG